MENKTYKSVVWYRPVAILYAFVVIYFVLTLTFSIFYSFLFNPPLIRILSLIIAIIFISQRGVNVSVRRDGVYYSKNHKIQVEYKYEHYNFSAASGKRQLRAESMKNNIVEFLNCPGIPGAKFKEMLEDIQKSQKSYFEARNTAGNVGNEEKAASRAAEIQSVNLNPDIPKVEVNTAESDFKRRHRDDFRKSVFYYQKYASKAASENSNVLFILITLFVAVLVYLIQYLVYINGTEPQKEYELGSGLIIFGLATLIIGANLIIRSVNNRTLFEKLEITDKHLIIDNNRYKFSEMTEMKMTSPKEMEGTRSIIFHYERKLHTYKLGPYKKQVGKSNAYFSRYNELYGLLCDKGFK